MKRKLSVLDIGIVRRSSAGRSKHLPIIVLLLVVLGACSTSVHVTKEFNQEDIIKSNIVDVTVRAKHLSGASNVVIGNLRNAILSQLGEVASKGSKPANLDVLITRAKFSTSASRFLIGAFAGTDELYVSVTLKDKKSNQIIASFDVNGDYNPGGLGAFATAEKYTANYVAETLVNKLYGAN